MGQLWHCGLPNVENQLYLKHLLHQLTQKTILCTIEPNVGIVNVKIRELKRFLV